ncbi:hypothetical protein KC19_10G023000 [Ceratodon purpureus]|uniref:Peptidase A2 domain-containing protein n=1 Tax=Ceratodon purpureus TaxID=3225 RepID=A0A8T0GIG6_CERPU|nr:hypothetical protein KC19_10G023000 [Ceratodon purpureus]
MSSLSPLQSVTFSKLKSLEEKNLLASCRTCNGPITKYDKTCPHCHLSSTINKFNEKNKLHCAQMSYRQRGSQHLDYIRTSDDEVCNCCVGYPNTCNSYSPGSSSKSDSECETPYYKPKKKSHDNSSKDPYETLEKNFDEWYEYWTKYEGYTPTLDLIENEESVAIVCGKVNGVQTTMLLDTGSSISAITESFAQQLHLETWYTDDVLVVTLANTHVERYPERMCIVTFEIGDLQISEELNVLPGQIYNITLGKNWLKSHMAICDYGLDILRLPGSRPIRMGIPAPIAPFKNPVKSKNKKPKNLLSQRIKSSTYPNLRTLLFMGGWLPPCLRAR